MPFANKFLVNKIQMKQAVESCLRGEKAGYYNLFWWLWGAHGWREMFKQCLAEMKEQFQALLAKEDINASCLTVMALWDLNDEQMGDAFKDIDSMEKTLKRGVEKQHAPSYVAQAISYNVINKEDTYYECSKNLLQQAWRKKFAPAAHCLIAYDENEQSKRSMLIEAGQDGYVPAMNALAEILCWSGVFFKLYGESDQSPLRNNLDAELRALTQDPILMAAVSTTSTSLWKTLMIRQQSVPDDLKNDDLEALEKLVKTLAELAALTWAKRAAEHGDAGAAYGVFRYYSDRNYLIEAAYWLQQLYCIKAVDDHDFALILWEECTPEAFDAMLTKYRPSQIYLPYADNDDFSYSDYDDVIKKHPFITNVFFVEIKGMNFKKYLSAPSMYTDIVQWEERLTEATKKAVVRSTNYNPTVWKKFTDDMQQKSEIKEGGSNIIGLEEVPQPRARSYSN